MPFILSSAYRREPGCGRFDSLGEAFHWREYHLKTLNFVYTVSGTGQAELDSGHVPFRPGEVVFFRPNTTRSYSAMAETPWIFYWVHLQRDWMRQKRLSFPALVSPSISAPLPAFAEPLLAELLSASLQRQDDSGNYSAELIKPLLAAAQRQTHSVQNPKFDPRIARATDWINQHFLHAFSIPELAQTVGLSRQRFTTLFSLQVGQSPAAYIEQRRLEYARRLLLTTHFSVSEIARRTGYECPFHFSRRFKHLFGSAPATLRKM